jgi:transcriptional regulator with XRE-family HTH domain
VRGDGGDAGLGRGASVQIARFARRLAQARERAGLSQKQLGILAGLNLAVFSPRINQYERGKHEPQIKTAKQLAELLGIPAAFLYTEDDLLAQLLLQWNDLSIRQKKDVLKSIENTPAKRERCNGR